MNKQEYYIWLLKAYIEFLKGYVGCHVDSNIKDLGKWSEKFKREMDLTEIEIIALLRIPYPKRTPEQNRQVGQFTTEKPEFNTDFYTKDLY